MFKPLEVKGSSPSRKLSKRNLSTRKFTPVLESEIEDRPYSSSNRRSTSIDPSVNVAEITRVARSSQGRTVVPDPDKVFHFRCGGTVGGDTLVAGKHVEWKANFDKPIEQLIYPSLQRFDIAKYERRVLMRQKLHGDSKGPADTATAGNVNANASGNSIKFFNVESDHGVKLEPLPENLLPTNEEILFMHTPKWTMKVSEEVKSSSGNLGEDGAPQRSLGEEIDIDGEKYIRQEMKRSVQEKEEERQKKEEAAASDVLSSWSRRVATRELKPIVQDPKEDAKLLYGKLLKQAQDRVDEEALQKGLGVFSSEISAFNRQKKIIADSIPRDQNHLLDGLLYYRHANENHKAQLEAQRESEETLMATYKSKQAPRRRKANTFVNRLTQRRLSNFVGSMKGTTTTENVDQGNSFQIIRTEDQVQPIAPEKFTRVQRAIDGRNVGLQQGRAAGTGGRRLGMMFNAAMEKETADEDDEADEHQKADAYNQMRHAQDTLLLHQLDRGVLPEQFIKQSAGSDDPRHVSIILSKYGIGDARGVCLGNCLFSIRHLECLGLSDNRLTAHSLPTIIDNMSFSTLLALDLSFNDMHQDGIHALAAFFKTRTVLQDVDISSCNLNCSDTKELCQVLSVYPNHVEELRISCNSIAEEGALEICKFLVSGHCHLKLLDLSWNTIGEKGAITFAQALVSNKSLSELNLASNGIGDNGGQYVVNSLKYHREMTKFNISQNDIAHRTCFVTARVLKMHPKLSNMDLTFNPLGEAGARCLFRNILRGITCWVFMGNCSFRENHQAFDATYPSSGNPYSLDLSEPYRAALLEELLQKYAEDPINCSFENMIYRDAAKGISDQPVVLAVRNKRVVLKSSGQPFIVPEQGMIRFLFQQAVSVPKLSNAIQPDSLVRLMQIVEAGREADRKKDTDKKKTWLYLLCQDVYFTVAQAQTMIDRFHSNGTIGDGELTKLDVLKSVWKLLLDTENMYDFLYRNTTETQRKDLVYALTLKRYKFNWTNPTAFWNLNLDDNTQRDVFMQIVAINNFESEFSKHSSGRGDTSQNGNWYNFRNARYIVNGVATENPIDREFIKNIPDEGTIEFDYVSTTRPTPGPDNPVRIINDDEMFVFCERLGLSSRKKVSNANSLFVLMDLQLASTMYYFTVMQLATLLDSFQDHWELQARVIVCLFSRIVDLHQMDMLMRNLDSRTQQEVFRRIGCLNLINPLKISFDYIIHLQFVDNRILLIAMMELASIESADQIVEDPNTELPIATLYGSYTRTLNETRPETMIFRFTDFGERTKTVSWSSRRELLKKFLVGTTPHHENLHQVISQYKEMEAAGKLTTGPIDQQYLNFTKQQKSSASRSAKNTAKMIGLMRSGKK